eukprot:CAMPEP_0119307346 /NCGR_PEP_ID=MMETSP1333-20130426/7876_1 /TAXON_ID=418940 /ORGANISM="Scyphosphaera apsteinii, Strain RCC1455" /LENGTH=447 /DNA_ID=CAMNT_0007310877 /DNA_START=95 /DNA_END=1438 /DNA_ORIENTATION=+
MGSETEQNEHLAAAATAGIEKLRAKMDDADDELRVETELGKKFLWRGQGLRADFQQARLGRRRALVNGAREKEAAIWWALEAAEACGLPQVHLEEAIRVANSLAITRAETEQAQAAMVADGSTSPRKRARSVSMSLAVNDENQAEGKQIDAGALGRYFFAVLMQLILITTAFGALDLACYGPLPWQVQLGGPLPWVAVFGVFFTLSLRSRVFSPLDNSRPELRVTVTPTEDAALMEALLQGVVREYRTPALRSECEARGLAVDRTMDKVMLEARLKAYFESKCESLSKADERIVPSWTPPGVAFPIMWVGVVAPLRAFASALVYETSTGRLNEAHLNDPVLIWLVLHLCLGDTWNTVNNVERRMGAAVVGVAIVWISTIFAAKQYYDVAPLAGVLLGLTALWIAVAGALVADIWRLNSVVEAEPLYPYKAKGMRSQTRLTIEGFEGL